MACGNKLSSSAAVAKVSASVEVEGLRALGLPRYTAGAGAMGCSLKLVAHAEPQNRQIFCRSWQGVICREDIC